MKFSNPDVRPTVPGPKFENVPVELKAKPQWVLWRFVWSKDSKQWAKVPYDANTRRKARSNDPATWSSFETAQLVYVEGQGNFDGVGFVFSVDDEYCGVDFDECLDTEGQITDPFVQEWIDRLDSYSEKSVSGTGVHVIIKGVPSRAIKNSERGVEVYDRLRYFTFSGNVGRRREIYRRQKEIEQLLRELEPEKLKPPKRQSNPNRLGPSSRELLEKAFAASNGNKIRSLYDGNFNGHGSQSEADLALCSALAFWSGGSEALLDEMFRGSALMREKWDKPHASSGKTYGQMTIEKALAGCSKFYSPSNPVIVESGHAKRKAGGTKVVMPQATPSQWFEERYPGLAEQFGEAVQEEMDKQGTVHARDINEDYLAATLGERGRPEAPTVFIPTEGRFWGYSPEDGIYVHQREPSLVTYLSDLLLQCSRDCKSPNCNTGTLQFRLRDAAQLVGVVKKAKGRLEKPADFFSTALTEFILCDNGVLRLSDNELLAFNPNFRRRNKLAVPFDPTAKCPTFLDTLMRPALDEDQIDLLQRWCGQALIGENIAQKMIILTGTAGGGKGTFIRVLCAVIGQNNLASLRPQLLGERFELSGFLGKTLLYGADVPENFLNQKGASILKALTGGDPMTLEFKNSNERPSITARYNVITTCNSRLTVHLEGDEDAWRRRLAIINYRHSKPEKVIADLDQIILATEGPGVLNWMLEGLAKLRADDWQLVLSDDQQRIVDNLLLESDGHSLFAREALAKADGALTVPDCWDAYVEFCNQRGWVSIGRSKFGQIIGDTVVRIHGLTTRNDVADITGKAQRGWKGLILKLDQPGLTTPAK